MLQVSQFRALRRASATAPSSRANVFQLTLARAFGSERRHWTRPFLVPEEMPPSYFRSIDEEDPQQPEVMLRSTDHRVFSHFRSGANFPGRLANIFTSMDDSLGLDIFRFGQQEPFLNKTEDEQLARANIQRFCAEIQAGKHASDLSYPEPGPHFEPEAMDLFSKVRDTEGVAVDVEHKWETRSDENKLGGGVPQTMLTIAASNLNVVRAHLDVVKDPQDGSAHVAMIRILVQPAKKLEDDFQFEWSRSRETSSISTSGLGLSRAELIYAYGNMLHGVLAKKDPFAYSLTRIMETLEHNQNLPLASRIADFFLTKFDHNRSDAVVEELKKEIRRNYGGCCAWHSAYQQVRARPLRVVSTYGPAVMGYGTVGKDTPYGVFFIYGRRFKGFHVRFRDIARGGLRMVYPSSTDAHALESARQYNEAYNLAFAQQLKNKDIPEGGSKAVVLCDPIVGPIGDVAPRDFIIRKSVKAFSDALLDLNTTDEEVKAKMVDYYGKDELIYLGPDENIIPGDIVWMTKRAAYRGYPIPRAFISSKPDAGFNHKVYGVTSEEYRPKNQPFTVKITGGTDGDVAGNVIKILHREYGNNLRIVGICDGTGVIEDPQGLDMPELLRLVHESLPLSSFDKSKVATTGVKYDINTQEGIRARNSMHNRVKSDLFIPAGGRPNTINENNWRDYLDADGKPSSGLIVEGANLFITPEARQLLFDNAGVVIVKDSSANKCGVVCSSYEIVASMLLETDEFLAVKDELVVEVVDKLRALARVEAQLLFREYKKDPTSALPPASERISRAITRVHDAVLAHFDDVCAEDQQILFTLIEEHLPPKLRELALDRVQQNVPLAYIRSIVASSLASKIVYREGLQFTEALPDSNLGNMALQYLKQEKKVQRLVKDVRSSQLPHKDDIADLLARGGVRAGLTRLTNQARE
ncbi:NAD(P)-binding domain [Phytophthora cactorum]|nr:NAD(P)-binding domain [Phytophthora cactorum]